jgi:hypothetical protein
MMLALTLKASNPDCKTVVYVNGATVIMRSNPPVFSPQCVPASQLVVGDHYCMSNDQARSYEITKIDGGQS